MWYKTIKCELPSFVKVGTGVLVSGDGDELYRVVGIERCPNGYINVYLDSCCREPLCKMYFIPEEFIIGNTVADELLAGEKKYWAVIEKGECDLCGTKFADSCVYSSGLDGKIYCRECTAIAREDGLLAEPAGITFRT